MISLRAYDTLGLDVVERDHDRIFIKDFVYDMLGPA